MKTDNLASFWASILLLCISVSPLSAEQFGLFTYEVVENTIPNDTIPQTEGYDLRLGSVASLSDLEDQGESVVIIALVDGDFLHIRIFDADGNQVADESEDESEAWQGLAHLKEVLVENPSVNESGANPSDRRAFIEEATSIIVTETGPIRITGYPKDAVGHVEIPAEIDGKPVTSIGEGAFASCRKITGVTIPNGVTRIGGRPFWSWLIGKGAFEGCERLTSIEIPKSVTEIGRTAFDGCSALKSIDVEPGNQEYSSGDGVLFNASEDHLIRCPEGKVGAYSIPEGVKWIIGKSVREHVIYNGAGAFENCRRLTKVTIPSTVTDIGHWAFSGCTRLTTMTISEAVTGIGDFAFRGCSALTAITFPDRVAYFGLGAFYGCSGLTSVSFGKRSSDLAIAESMFYGCTSLNSVSFGNVTEIRWGAFKGCTGLTSIILPDSVTVIAPTAFDDCNGLTSISLGNVTEIRWGAFSGCRRLAAIHVGAGHKSYSSVDGVLYNAAGTSLIRYPEGKVGVFTIPESVTEIGDLAFSGCSGLTSVTLPESVTEIGSGAFGDCTDLTAVSIPGSVTEIGWSVFFGCRSLTNIHVEAGNENYATIDGVLYDAAGANLIHYPAGKVGTYTIPKGVTEIGWGAFSGRRELSAIHVETGNDTYSSVDGVLYNADRTSLIRYPEGKVGRLTIPESVTEIGVEALEGCTGLMSIEVDAQNANYRSLGGVLFDKGGTTLIQYPAGRSGDYTIPEGVTHIGKNAFSGCRGLTSVTIPGSLTYIRDDTFRGCSGLTSIEVDAQNPRYSSLDGVLFNKDRTELIRYPAGRSGDYTIPESVTSIRSITCSGWSALTGCGGEGAFAGSSKLTGVSIPVGVTSIGAETFAGCTSLTTVTIPASVTFMGHQGDGLYDFLSGAFEGCTNLRSAFFLGDAPRRFDWNTFTNAAPGFTIFYPSCSTGFTSPTWNGYPAVRVDEQTCPQAAWLTEHGFAYDTDLYQDLNGDGVSLLMAYALDLDPHQNLRNRLPSALPVEDGMVMVFHAASRGVAYEAQTSTDLQHWTSEGISLSDLGADNQITASMAFDEPNRFMRLVITEE